MGMAAILVMRNKTTILTFIPHPMEAPHVILR